MNWNHHRSTDTSYVHQTVHMIYSEFLFLIKLIDTCYSEPPWNGGSDWDIQTVKPETQPQS